MVNELKSMSVEANLILLIDWCKQLSKRPGSLKKKRQHKQNQKPNKHPTSKKTRRLPSKHCGWKEGVKMSRHLHWLYRSDHYKPFLWWRKQRNTSKLFFCFMAAREFTTMQSMQNENVLRSWTPNQPQQQTQSQLHLTQGKGCVEPSKA